MGYHFSGNFTEYDLDLKTSVIMRDRSATIQRYRGARRTDDGILSLRKALGSKIRPSRAVSKCRVERAGKAATTCVGSWVEHFAQSYCVDASRPVYFW
jgi:hypothetical protein